MTGPCPKCGYCRQATDTAPDWQWPRCGIAYAKYQARLDAATALPTEVVRPAGTRKRSFNEVITMCVGVTAVMLLARGMRGSISVVNGVLLVPFFFCLVGAVSSVIGDGLYYWNRWTMSFDVYDDEAHPIIFRLLQFFYFACAAVVAVFFFMLRL